MGKIEDFIRNIIIYCIHRCTRNENHGKCRLKMWTEKNRPWTSLTFGILFNVDTLGECSVKHDLIASMSSTRREFPIIYDDCSSILGPKIFVCMRDSDKIDF